MVAKVLHGDNLASARTIPDESIDLIYLDPPFLTQRDLADFDDYWRDIDSYTEFIKRQLTVWHGKLKPTGNLILHLDWHASHYAKVEGDEVFGYENFRNEIVWSYNSGGASKRHLARKHDVLLWWSKSDGYTFNVLREPYATSNVGGRAGFHPEGRMLTDVWRIPFISTTSKERTGYATQKPVKLLERVVEVFSNPGDVVLDPFCGSGTTGAACATLGRNAILMDSNARAVELTQGRLGAVTR